METPSQVQSILISAQKGDEESFRVLYGMLSPRVFRFIRPRARDRDDALDVLQETFIDFWKYLPTFIYQGDSALDAFLYRIASRKIGKLFRLWRPHISLESVEDVIVDASATLQGTHIDVAFVLAGLKVRDRELIVLRHLEGRSFSDISQLLGESENAIKVRHHRAITRLRKKTNYV